MIAIVNISNEPKQAGTNTYEIRINNHAITQFTHNREEGLSVCLQKAAEAAAKNEVERLIELLKFLVEKGHHST